jgi:hypothetical protein
MRLQASSGHALAPEKERPVSASGEMQRIRFG